MPSAFASLPKSTVDVQLNGRANAAQHLRHLRSHNIVYVKGCTGGSTVVVSCNQRCHQVVIDGCDDVRVFILDSAVIASRTVSIANSCNVKVFLEDVDVRRVEAWNVSNSTVSIIGDDVLSEDTSILWNAGCHDNSVQICDLYCSGEPRDEDAVDQDVVPFKVISRFAVPNTTTPAAPEQQQDEEMNTQRKLTVLKPITYPHTIPFDCHEAQEVLHFHNRFIPDSVLDDCLRTSETPPPLSPSAQAVLVICERLSTNPPSITDAQVEQAYDEERLEYTATQEELQRQAQQTAEALRRSRYSVVFTGAGISTSANIPDFRGPKGLWTTRDKTGSTNGKGLDMPSAFPTYSHFALTHLAKMGLVKFVVSTNMDGLHCRSGLPRHMIEELHGSCYTEICGNCKLKHIRAEEVNPECWGSHNTGRHCRFCNSALEDSIVNFAETYRDMTQPLLAGYHCRRADFALVLGTSMAVQPAVTFPLKVLSNTTAKPLVAADGEAGCCTGEMCLVNMQHTPADKAAAIRVYAPIDDFMKMVMEELGQGGAVNAAFDALPDWLESDRLASEQAARHAASGSKMN